VWEGEEVQALVKERPETGLSLLEIDTPGIDHPDDVLFEVGACAICTGELKVYDWGAWAASDKTIELPTVLGHEASGTVVEVGDAVTTCEPGDRIVVDPIIGCGRCEMCLSDRANMCGDREIYGKRRGALAGYAVLPERAICPMPEGLSFEEGALLENFGIAAHAVEGFAHAPGDLSLVVGSGPIGIMAAQVLAAWGQRVVITDLVPYRLRKARQLVDGAVLDASQGDLVAQVHAMSDGIGADFVLEAAGTPSALDQAFECVRNCGTVVTIGTFDRAVDINPFFQMTRREISLASRMGRTQATWMRMNRLLATGRFGLDAFVSRVMSLDAYEEGFSEARSPNVMKVVLQP